jgi:hypothetical protein
MVGDDSSDDAGPRADVPNLVITVMRLECMYKPERSALHNAIFVDES